MNPALALRIKELQPQASNRQIARTRPKKVRSADLSQLSDLIERRATQHAANWRRLALLGDAELAELVVGAGNPWRAPVSPARRATPGRRFAVAMAATMPRGSRQHGNGKGKNEEAEVAAREVAGAMEALANLGNGRGKTGEDGVHALDHRGPP
jgi:hypothetical protein